MIDILRDLFGRWTPFVVLGLVAALFVVMLIFGLNFG